MTATKKISRYLQIILLLTFFLPFFPSGCIESSYEDSVDSLEVTEAPVSQIDSSCTDSSYITDTSLSINPGIDTLTVDSLKDKSRSHDTSSNSAKETISDNLIKRVSFLKYFLKFDYKYSGIGYIIDTILLMVIGFGIIISFVLWLIGLFLKNKGNKWFHVLNIAGLLLFYITNPIVVGFYNQKLWGYWVCFWWAVAMIILDLYIFFKMRKITGA